MKRFAPLFFAVLLCATLAAPSAHATEYGDISVRVETITGGGLSARGYGEYRATIVNRSTTTSHRVTIELVSSSYTEGAARRTLDLAPSSTMTVPLLVPGNSYGSEEVRVSIDGSRQEKPVEVDRSRTNSWVSRSYNLSFLLVSPDVDKSGLMNEAAVNEGFKNSSSGQIDVSYLAYKSPISEWSPNWIAYSCFDGVVITAEELRAAPDAVRSALWRFAECGGSLLILSAGNDWQIPDQWRSRRAAIVASEENDIETKDEEVIEAVEKSAGKSPKKTPITLSKEIHRYYVGFGDVIILDAARVKSVHPTQWRAIKNGFMESHPGRNRKPYGDILDINRDFPVVEKIGIPARGLFVLMLVFVIAIGPINLIWLARIRRKIWMLWTVPAIALVTCLAVTVFAIFSEGVSAMARAESFTILNESSHRASTIGWTAFYAPITPREGLRFSYDTELTPVRPESFYYYNRGIRFTIDLSNDQHLDSGWITARSPVYFKFRKSETRRERLAIRQEGGGAISVVNGLGADIRELWVADRDGKVYSARGLRAGAEAKLSPANLNLVENGASLRVLFSSDEWPENMKAAGLNPEKFLAPGCYLAALDESPFVEEGLKNVKTRKGSALVYGVGAPIAKDER